jgi:tight adherence protein C
VTFAIPIEGYEAGELAVLALAFTASVLAAVVLMGTIALVRRREPDPETPAPRVFGPLTPAIAATLPATAAGREGVRRDLLRAGYFEPVAADNFQAVRSVLTYVPLLAGLIPAALLVDGPIAVAFFATGAVAALLGFFLPRLILWFLGRQREEEVRRGLPMLMDTLGLTLSTGASLPAALGASGEAIRRGYPELAREVRVMIAQARLRSLSHSLDQWKDRMPIPELGSLAFLLAQADRQGTDVTAGLWELSSSLQVNARQRAEAAAGRMSFYMIFPSVLCLLLAAGLMLAGPGIVQLLETKKTVDQILDEAKDHEQLIRKGQEKFLGPPRASPGGGLSGGPAGGQPAAPQAP